MLITAQIMSFIAFILFISSVQMKEKKQLLIYQLFANLLYGISYLFLNTPIAFMMNIISVIRCGILYISKKTPSKIYMFILIIITLILGFLMCDSLFSFIPICITILYTLSNWQDDMKFIRYLFIVAGFFWIFYNFKVGAYVAIIGNIFEITSGIISIIRYKKSE